MNRVIKFRAWDKSFKKMYNWDYFLKNYNMRAFNSGYVIIMQFTGLLDKNGKEIFEGDVLTGFGFKAVVYYKIVNGRFEAYEPNGLHRLLAHKFPLFEIIGNMFENPELLEN